MVDRIGPRRAGKGGDVSEGLFVSGGLCVSEAVPGSVEPPLGSAPSVVCGPAPARAQAGNLQGGTNGQALTRLSLG